MRKQTKQCDKLGFSSLEAYKKLRKNLQFALTDIDGCRVMGITSSEAEEGKSTIAINLSYAFALTGKRVLLIDGDMRTSSVSYTLFEKDMVGLSESLAGLESSEDVIQCSSYLDNWKILPGGEIPPNPSELLGSENMKRLIQKLREYYDYIILDLPPVGIVSDALETTDILDGIMVVVRQNKTDKRKLYETVRQLKMSDTTFLGFVLNDFKSDGVSI